jgi:putative membrane protein
LSVLLSAVDAPPFGWHAHPEVWLLVAAVIGLGVYVARVIAPKVPESMRGPGPAITRAQKCWFAAGVLTLWASADWPMHDLAEQYLYSVHMLQHTLLTLVMPPMFWLATPRWLAQLVVPPGSRFSDVLHRLARPVPAAVIFNAMVLVSHAPGVVNLTVANGPFHYTMHLILVSTALLMWIPVCGPWEDLRISPIASCIYLFAQSIIPTVPGAWLAMADSPVYAAYDHGPRLLGITVMADQQTAGMFMKLAESAYLWGLIIVIFSKYSVREEKANKSYLVRVDDGVVYRLSDDAPIAGEPIAVAPGGAEGIDPDDGSPEREVDADADASSGAGSGRPVTTS